MTTQEIIIAVTIHAIMPIGGIVGYIILMRKMSKEIKVSAIHIEYFIAFVNCGNLLLILLTAMFWYWSGMASLGAFYSLAATPIMGIIAYRYYKRRNISKYHKWLYLLAIGYILTMILIYIYAILKVNYY